MERKYLILFIIVLLGITFFFLPKREKISIKKVTPVKSKKIRNYTYHPILSREERKKEEKQKIDKEKKEEKGMEIVELKRILPQEREEIEEEIKKDNEKFHIKPTLKEIEDLRKRRVILY